MIIQTIEIASAAIIILFVGVVLTLALRAMQNYNIATLYQTFNVFNRYIDKASTTIPKYSMIFR